jgi:hypothetical protein
MDLTEERSEVVLSPISVFAYRLGRETQTDGLLNAYDAMASPSICGGMELNLRLICPFSLLLLHFQIKTGKTSHSRRLPSALYFTDLFSILSLGNVVAAFHQTENKTCRVERLMWDVWT